ncbi:MAG: four helix bundle protein [Candidatus Margulisiibacteriota bacterium]
MNDNINYKLQASNDKQYQNNKNQKLKQYDLEDRTLRYAKRVNEYARNLPKSLTNIENGKQLVRAAGSVGANYIEANEALSKKDFLMRIKISRKEAKESRYWLYLTNPIKEFINQKQALIKEATELTKIFSAILIKSQASSTK